MSSQQSTWKPSLSPTDSYYLAAATYEKTGGANASLSEQESEWKAIEQAKFGPGWGQWKMTLYKNEKTGQFVVGFRGTTNVGNAFLDAVNEIGGGDGVVSSMEKQIQKWVRDPQVNISTFVAHSAGGFFASRVFQDNPNIERITFNGQQCLPGPKNIHLSLSLDLVSRVFSDPKNYWCVGSGGHRLENFKECMVGRTWNEIKHMKDAAGTGGILPRVQQVVGRVLQNPRPLLEEAVRKALDKIPFNQRNPKLSKFVMGIANDLYKKGEAENFASLTKPAFLQQVLEAGINSAIEVGQGKLEEKLGDFAAILKHTPANELASQLLSLPLTFEGKREVLSQVLEQVKQFRIPEKPLKSLLKEARKLHKKMGDPEFMAELGKAAGEVGSELFHSSQRRREENKAEAIQRGSEKRVNFQKNMERLAFNPRPMETFFRAYTGSPKGIHFAIQEADSLAADLKRLGGQIQLTIDNLEQEGKNLENRESMLIRLEQQLSEQAKKKQKFLGKLRRVTAFAVMASKTAFPEWTLFIDEAERGVQYGIGIAANNSGAKFDKGIIATQSASATVDSCKEITEREKQAAFQQHQQWRNMLIGCLEDIPPWEARAMISSGIKDRIAEKRKQANQKKDEALVKKAGAERHLKELRAEKDLAAAEKQVAAYTRAAKQTTSPISDPDADKGKPSVREGIAKERGEALKKRDEAANEARKQRDEAAKLKNKKKKRKDHDARIAEAESQAEQYEQLAKKWEDQVANLDAEKAKWEEIDYRETLVAPIRDHNWKVVQSLTDSRWGTDPDRKAILQTFHKDHGRYQSAREPFRSSATTFFSSAGALASEIGYWSGSQGGTQALQTMTQLYQLYDMGQYWADYALPALINLGKTGGGGRNALDVLFSIEGIVQFIGPAGAIVAQALACGRMLYQLFASNSDRKTEHQKLLEEFHKGMCELHKAMNLNFSHVHDHLDSQTAIILSQIQRRTDLIRYQGIRLRMLLRSSVREIKDEIKTEGRRNYIHNDDIETNQQIGNLAHALHTGNHEAAVSWASIALKAELNPETFPHPSMLPLNPDRFICWASNKMPPLSAHRYIRVVEHLLESGRSFGQCYQKVWELIHSQGEAFVKVGKDLPDVVDQARNQLDLHFRAVKAEHLKRLKTQLHTSLNTWVQANPNETEFEIVGSKRFTLNTMLFERSVKPDRRALRIDRWDDDFKGREAGLNLLSFVHPFAAPVAGLFLGPLHLGEFAFDKFGGYGPVSLKTCYDDTEEAIQRLVSQSLGHIIAGGELNTSEAVKHRARNLRRNNQNLTEISDLDKVTISARWSIEHRRFVYRADYWSGNWRANQDRWYYIDFTGFSDETTNATPLLHVNVEFDLRAQTYTTNFKEDSKIKRQHVRNVQNIDENARNTYERILREKITEYKACIHQLAESENWPGDGLGKKLGSGSYVVTSTKQGQLPLAFPKACIEALYEKTEIHDCLHDAMLFPRYEFKIDDISQKGCELIIRLYDVQGRCFKSCTVANIDWITYLSFGYAETQQDDNKWTLKTHLPDEEEVLIALMYGDLMDSEDSIGWLPGPGTQVIPFREQGMPLIIPSVRKGPGVWTVLSAKPHMQVNYCYNRPEPDLRVVDTECTSLGNSFASISRTLKTASDKKMKQIEAEYGKEYYRLEMLAGWESGMKREQIQDLIWVDLGLPPLEALSRQAMQELGPVPSSEQIEAFIAKLRSWPGGPRQRIEELLERAKKRGAAPVAGEDVQEEPLIFEKEIMTLVEFLNHTSARSSKKAQPQEEGERAPRSWDRKGKGELLVGFV